MQISHTDAGKDAPESSSALPGLRKLAPAPTAITTTTSKVVTKRKAQFVTIRSKPKWQPLSPTVIRRLKLQQPPAVTGGEKGKGRRRRCLVPCCPQRNCSLQSHKHYVANSERSSNKHDPPATPHEPDSLDPEVFTKLTTLVTGGLSGFPSMPLKSLETAEFRSLFRDFYLVLFDRIHALLAPPAVLENETRRRRQEKETMFAEAMTNPAYCLNYIATTHHYLVLRHGVPPLDRTTAAINVQLVRLLREKLDDFKVSNILQLLYVVLTLVTFDIGQGKTISLNFHRKAMVSLVNSYGGLHNLGRATPYVLNLDRMISMHTGQTPIFAPFPDLAFTFQRAPRHARRYGSIFDDDEGDLSRTLKAHVDSDVIRYCTDTCRAIEILEGEDWTFDPTRPNNSSEIHYFYFLRERIVNRFVHLNAKSISLKQNGVSRCVLLAAKIVEYTVLMDNYLNTIPIFLGDRLQETLQQQDFDVVWDGLEDVFIWVLFVLLGLPDAWRRRSWTLHTLRDRLDERYGRDLWPVDWVERQRKSICCFVWSETRLASRFDECCGELRS